MAHKHRPTHVHDDLFSRLSRSAVEGLNQAEREMQDKFKPDLDKASKAELGKELLDKYMSILNRPGSMLQKSMCARLSLRVCYTQRFWLNVYS